MRAPRFGRPHSLPPWLSLLAIPLLLWPVLLHASGDFAAPTPRMIDQLRQQHAAEDWLRVTVEMNRLELMTSTSAEIVATEPAPAEAWVTKVRARIKPGELLRLTGDFGQFSGRAAVIDHQGFSGLQRHPAFESTVPLPSEPLSWTEISRVERRGNSAGRYAVYGGIGLGLAFGTFAAVAAGSGAFSVGASTTSIGDLARGFLVGSVFGALVGGAIGGLTGLMVPRWNRVHP